MSIAWNLYNGADGTTPTITQFSQSSATNAVTQNGAASANLSSVSLGNGGQVIALYDNGQQVVVGQMAMASIRNPDSLIGAGDNNYPGQRRPRRCRRSACRERAVEARCSARSVEVVDGGYGDGIHESDRVPAQLRGQRARGHDGRSDEPGHHQPEHGNRQT